MAIEPLSESTKVSEDLIKKYLRLPEDITFEGGNEVSPRLVPDWVVKGIAVVSDLFLTPQEDGRYFDVLTDTWLSSKGMTREDLAKRDGKGTVQAAKIFIRSSLVKEDWLNWWGIKVFPIKVIPGSFDDNLVHNIGRIPFGLNTKEVRYCPEVLIKAAKKFDDR